MALCFVANKDLTIPYSDIAKQLRARGEEIVWLSPSHRWTGWLIQEGWPRQDIVSIPDFAAEWQSLSVEEAFGRLAGLESDAPQTISNIIQTCRHLCARPASLAYRYLAVVRTHVQPFLLERGVEMVFGEGTWGFELMIWLVGKRIGIPMLTATSTRIPSGRFYFADAVSSELYPISVAAFEDVAWAEEFLQTWCQRPEQPDYMSSQGGGYKLVRRRWLSELITAISRPDLAHGDETLWPLRARIADRIRRGFNAKTLDWFPPFERTPSRERYVLYPLHHQPEASVDVVGSLNSNQHALINTLSRILPSTHKLWVKEHQSGLGDRSAAWFRSIRKLPNVRLLSPFMDVFPLIRNADLVVTICGTTGYEASLLGVRAVGLAPVYFRDLLTNRPTHRSHPLEWRMSELLEPPSETEKSRTRQSAIAFIAHVHANSFLGDPMNHLEASKQKRLAAQHLAPEANGFMTFVEGARRKTEASLQL